MSSLPPAQLPLSRIVPRAHELLAPALAPGALAVDLTAGNGLDTLFLFQQVGPAGRVVAFDLQPAALDRSEALLASAGASVLRYTVPRRADLSVPGVHLLNVGHERVADYLTESPRAFIANLGYLPGGSPTLTTTAATTALALAHAGTLLALGGRLAVVAYPGHNGGEVEAATVEEFFARLPTAAWQTLRLAVPNARGAPLLLVAQKL